MKADSITADSALLCSGGVKLETLTNFETWVADATANCPRALVGELEKRRESKVVPSEIHS